VRLLVVPPLPGALEEALRGLSTGRDLSVTTTAAAPPPDDSLEVCDVLALPASQTGSWLPSLERIPAEGRPAVVVWGDEAAAAPALEDGADLWLPEDATAPTLAAQLGALLRRLAEGSGTRDPRTGFVRRSALLQLVQHELERSQRYRRPVSLLSARVAPGAERARTAEALRVLVRSVDRVGPLSEAVWLALMPETDAKGAWAAAQRLEAELAGSGGGRGSIGLATFPCRGVASGEDLISRALESLAQGERSRRVVPYASPDVVWSRTPAGPDGWET
jgi:GGDEF domain-containing protein